jgi:hypothetical protein
MAFESFVDVMVGGESSGALWAILPLFPRGVRHHQPNGSIGFFKEFWETLELREKTFQRSARALSVSLVGSHHVRRVQRRAPSSELTESRELPQRSESAARTEKISAASALAAELLVSRLAASSHSSSGSLESVRCALISRLWTHLRGCDLASDIRKSPS